MYLDDFKRQLPDSDPQETQEWLDALEQITVTQGKERAQFLLRKLLKKARMMDLGGPIPVQTPYINTISPEQEPPFPGDEQMELRIRRMIRWNAVAMVVRANNLNPGIGGHLSTYASSASLYEVGFNHFFRGKDDGQSGDQVFYQGHAAPGIYARAFLEGRLSESQLEHFRREAIPGTGLSSYPHPRLMPEFWEFPTVSMGIGPLSAIYQARFNRYLNARGLKDTSQSKVWAFLGDGEMDEPESTGALSVAGREKLDNLIFVVNCNLQRLDGPVRGNGKVIQEFESIFRGAGWNVIKVIWSRDWDPIWAKDVDGLFLSRAQAMLDGDFQKISVESGAYIRRHLFGMDERLLKLVEHLSDDQLEKLRRGGHDYNKLFAAYRAAVNHKGQPTVILAKTIKGWTLGEGLEGRNATHQIKKMNEKELQIFRDLLDLPIPDAKLKDAPFYHPGPKSPEVQYLLDRRQQLGGCVPKRVVRSKPLNLPKKTEYTEFLQKVDQEVSTTMTFVRLLRKLIDDPEIGKRVVLIIPDEARTFGMDFLFKKIGIYAPFGQLYDPVDSNLLFSYRELKDGQILEEGITEAGSMASFTAAGTCYSTHGENLIPFYMYYSMFGFQRTGDQAWAFADARGRGFLIGGTSGRTTLNGEGLQHEDGHSHIQASVIPNILSYDPGFHFEIAVIVREGLRRMMEAQEDVFYYITVHNENYAMPAMPDREGVEEGIIKGLYLFRPSPVERTHRVQLLGSSSIIMQVLRAQEILAEKYDVAADVWSATSYQQLRLEALEVDRWNLHHPESPKRKPYVTQLLEKAPGPIVAASDFVKAWPDMIAPWVPQGFSVLGTDGFGMSDTREVLRRHFEVDAESIAAYALYQLVRQGSIPASVLAQAKNDLGITETDEKGIGHGAD